MKLFFLKIFIFSIVVVFILFIYGQFCEWFFLQKKYFPKENKRMWAMCIENQNFDYAVLGSSRANSAFDMNMLNDSLEMNGVNIAADGSGYVDNYLLLYTFLENKNKIKYLFLQTDNYSFDPEKNFSNAFHVYNFLPFWHIEEYKNAISHYLNKTDGYLFNQISWIRYYKYNKYFSPLQVVQRLRSTNKQGDGIKLQFKSDSIINGELDTAKLYGKKKSKDFTINKFDENYLLKIIELCRRKNIEIVCFQAPDFYFQKFVYNNYTSTSEHLEKILNAENVTLIHPDSMICNMSKCFKDASHLNDYGRFLFTNNFFKEVESHLR